MMLEVCPICNKEHSITTVPLAKIKGVVQFIGVTGRYPAVSPYSVKVMRCPLIIDVVYLNAVASSDAREEISKLV